MPKEAELAIPPPVAGVNLATSVDKLQPIEALDISGFEFDEYGVLGAPRGPKNLGTIVAGAYVCSAHVFIHSAITPRLIVQLSDGTIRVSSDFWTTTTTASWTTILTGYASATPISFRTWLGKVWFCNGNNNLKSWDGTTIVDYPSAPRGRFLEVWRDTLWVSGDYTSAATCDRVYQSEAGDPTVWPAFNFVDIGKGADGAIIGLHAVETSLVVFKLTKTHIIYDPVEYTNRVLDHDKGCLSNTSIVSHNGLLYFVSHLGICRFLGDGPSMIISEKISPLFDDLYIYGTGLATKILSNEGEMWFRGYSFENYVSWYLPNALGNQYVKYYPDLPDKPWLFGTPVSSYEYQSVPVTLRQVNNPEQLYVISDYPAKLERMYGGTLAESVQCRWITGWFDFGDPMVEKYLSIIEILHRGTITVRINRDYKNQTEGGEDSEDWQNIASGYNKLSVTTLYVDNYGYYFQFEITSSTAGEQKQLMGSGISTQAYITRFQAGIAAIRCRAKLLSMMRR